MIQRPYNLLFFFLSFSFSLVKLVRIFSKLSLNLFNEKKKEEESEADKGNKHTHTHRQRAEEKKSMMTNRKKESKKN
jgi:hypothetical protein